ncbi:MAG: DUF433 domain-containing protein [Tepidisphaeraceae bacterium]
MRWQDYIEQRPDVMLGKPVFKDTRLTVQHVLERLGQGATEAELLHAHPTLRPEHIRAAQAYAAAALAVDEHVFSAEESV